MTCFERHLQAAAGYLELGLPLEAHEELESIDAEQRICPEVLALRADIYRRLGKWRLLHAVAGQLMLMQPENPRWVGDLAEAYRRMAMEGL